MGKARRPDSRCRASATSLSVSEKPRRQRQTLATPLIDDGEDPESPPVGELIVNEIHASVLVGSHRRGHWTTMQADALTPRHSHPQDRDDDHGRARGSLRWTNLRSLRDARQHMGGAP